MMRREMAGRYLVLLFSVTVISHYATHSQKSRHDRIDDVMGNQLKQLIRSPNWRTKQSYNIHIIKIL
jgi:hypothetical protein